MNTIVKRTGLGLAAGAVAILAGCSGSGSTPEPATGVLNLAVSDTPIKDAAKVCIKFDGVELKKSDGGAPFDIDFDAPVVINLLANQGALSETLVSEEVEAGRYDWVRLKVDAVTGNGAGVGDSDPTDPTCIDEESGSYLLTDTGGLYNIWVPSGAQTGLKLIGGLTVPAGGTGNYTAEFDLGRSFIDPPGIGTAEAIMKPVIKLVQDNEVGTLNGMVDDVLVTDPLICDPEAEIPPSVYVFTDDGDPDNSVDGDGASELIATGLVAQDMQGAPYTYEIGFLLAGQYEVAYTCNGTDFIPPAGKFAEIVEGAVRTVNFFAEDAEVPPADTSLN